MTPTGMVQPMVSLEEAQAFLRLDQGQEEGLLAGLIRTASGLCEQFLNKVVITRAFSENATLTGDWHMLSTCPVRAIDAVLALDLQGGESPLPPEQFSIDLDAEGRGWVRVIGPAAQRVRVGGTAGFARNQNEVPEPLRQGVLRLVAHLFAERDSAGAGPPAAVTALWRPYRLTRLVP